jgi:hypothetical protein
MANFDKQMSTWRRDPEKSEFLANKVTCPFCRRKKNCENCCVFLGSNLSSYLGGEGKEMFSAQNWVKVLPCIRFSRMSYLL